MKEKQKENVSEGLEFKTLNTLAMGKTCLLTHYRHNSFFMLHIDRNV